MKIQKIVLVIILALLLSTCKAATSDNNDASNIPVNKIGDRIKGISYKIDQGRSQQYLKVGPSGGKYLFISLTTDRIYSHLNISLNIYSLQSQNLLRKCVRQEIDSCYIEQIKVKEGESLLLIIEDQQKKQEYPYQIYSYWTNQQRIQLGKQIKFIFSKAEQKQIYSLDLTKQTFKELKIIIKPQTRRYAFDKIKMYGTYGKDSQPSFQNYDFKSVYLWQDVEGIYLNKKQMKQLTMNFILYGQIQTIYTMRSDLIADGHHSISLNSKIYQYLETGQVYDYHLQFTNKQGKFDYQEFLFRVAKFTGHLNIEFFSDKAKKNRVKIMQPSMYMGDIQYMFLKQEIEKEYPKGLYIEVSTQYKYSTYTMQFQGRHNATALQLHQHVYQFLQVEHMQFLFIRLAKYSQKNDVSKNSGQIMKIVFTLLRVTGKIHIQFRKCLQDELTCTGPNYLQATQTIQSQIRSIGQKDIHTLHILQDFWKHVNIVQQNAILIIVLTNGDKNTTGMAALQYNVGSRPQFLRQNKPIQSHLIKDQLKIYKYVNTDPNIYKIRIFITKISGNFKSYFFRKQQQQTQQQIKKQTQENNHQITGNLFQTSEYLTQKPIILVLQGFDSATYSITLQTLHKDNQQLNSIVLSQGVEFKTKIGPNTYQVLAINPIVSSISFKYKATGAVHVCRLNQQNKCTETKLKYKNQGQIIEQDFMNRTLLLEIRNPHPNNTIELTSIFTSKIQSNCQPRQMGQLYRQGIGAQSCLSTVIHQKKDFEVSIFRQYYGNFTYAMVLCNKLLNIGKKQEGQQRYTITAKQIDQHCQNHDEYIFSFTSYAQSKIFKVYIKYLIQYKDDRIILPDGIGYHGSAVVTDDALKTFSYKLLNRINTSILVISQRTLVVVAKLVNAYQADRTKIGKNDFHYTSEKQMSFFSEYMFIKIDRQSFADHKCIQCQLVIALFSNDEAGEKVQYTIQVSQNFAMLQEGIPKKAFLTQNSLNYYGFNIKNQGQILIEATDNNQNCLQIYSSTQQYPDQKKNQEKSYDGQIIADLNGDYPTYYITVKARKNCAYTIVATLTQFQEHITKLTRGDLGYANLAQNQVKYFTFKHLSQKSIKILSLHNYGHVQFYLNKTTPEALMKLFQTKDIKYQQFTYHSSHKNRLILDKQQSQFCKDCYYVLAVVAKKHTQSSLYLGDQQTKITLTQDKVLNDFLPKQNSITKAQMYGIYQGTMQVKVHSGKLNAVLTYRNQTINKVFQKAKELQQFKFVFKSTRQQSYFARLNIAFSALQDTTVYSARVQDQKKYQQQKAVPGAPGEPGVQHQTLNSQEPTYAYLQKVLQRCYDGFLKRADQKIFVSFSSNDRELAKQLVIIAKLNGNLTSIVKQHTRNVISVQYIQAVNFTNGAIPFSICLQSPNKSVPVTIFQQQQTNLLPDNTQMVVLFQKMYDIYPQGSMLLDVFQCRGSAKVAFGSSKKQLQNKKQKVLQMIGMPNQPHAIKLETRYSNVLLKISGQLSVIRWLSINQQQEKGVGYYLYQAGKLKYNNVFGEIQFLIDPIKSIKKTQTKIEQIVYNLYISPNQTELQEASNCQLFLTKSVSQYKVTHQKIIDKSFKFVIQKNKLLQKYKQSQNLYVSVVADVKLKTPDNTSEEYRFIYNDQEVPAIVFMPNHIQKYDASTLVTVVVVLIFLIIVLAYVFKNVVVPYLGKRNRALVEENAGEPQPDIKEDKLQPLPSTERNVNVQTDTKM